MWKYQILSQIWCWYGGKQRSKSHRLRLYGTWGKLDSLSPFKQRCAEETRGNLKLSWVFRLLYQLLFSKDSEEMNIHILWRNLVSIFVSLVGKTRRIHNVYKSTRVLGLRILHPGHWGHFTQFLVICRQMFYFVAFWKYPFKNSNQFPPEVLSIL